MLGDVLIDIRLLIAHNTPFIFNIIEFISNILEYKKQMQVNFRWFFYSLNVLKCLGYLNHESTSIKKSCLMQDFDELCSINLWLFFSTFADHQTVRYA